MEPGPSLLPLIDAALRGAGLALLGLMLARLLRRPRRMALERVGLPLSLGLMVQLVSSWPVLEHGPPALWRAPLVGVSMGNALLFWLWVRALCDDDFAPRRRHAAAWLAVAAAGGLNLVLLMPWCAAGAPGWAQALSRLVLALPLVFGLLSVATAVARWQDDLVERRRGLRAAIIVGGTLYTLLQVLVRHQRADNRLSPEAAVLDAAALALIVAAAAWLLLMRREAVPATDGLAAANLPRPLPPPPATTAWAGDPPAAGAGARAVDGAAAAGAAHIAAPIPSGIPAGTPVGGDAPPSADAAAVVEADANDAADRQLVDALRQAMEASHAYRDPELSVAGLAARLRVPEYRLRRVIHQRLGHRHFSAYLNHYRLADVQTALADPDRADRPVLTLALEAGFGSVGPFNRAFKALTGLTPTDFRRRHQASPLADS